MNIFEDLVEELKEENLLEETVIEINQVKESKTIPPATELFFASETTQEFPKEDELANVLSEFKDVLEEEKNQPELQNEPPFQDFAFAQELPMPAAQITETEYPENAPIPPTPNNEAEFYTRRANEEVSGLQLVEHVFSGVEREQMKTLPKPYDDLECKKALHAFLQISAEQNSPEHAQAEFRLMQETESWYSALSRRDRNISVTHLRCYCETTRPSLSSTALISMARFYRNAPFSEQVRSKFDLILTRLFTKEVRNEKRELPFTREEFIKHLDTLYSQWASIPLYTASDDESEILLMALKFEEFISEVDAAECFDDLIKTDFFNRLRAFKESTNENFFAPLVTATAVECNVRVGNRYVDLIQAEKEKADKSLLEDKYGFLHDQAISEASSKTLQLAQLLKEKAEIEEIEKEEPKIVETPKQEKRKETPLAKTVSKKEEKTTPYRVNKWLLAATILIVVVNLGLYIWMSGQEPAEISQQVVERVSLENSSLREYIREARIGNSTFFGVVYPNWKTLSGEKQEEILKKIQNTSAVKGFSKVHLLNSDGKTVGYADAAGVKVY